MASSRTAEYLDHRQSYSASDSLIVCDTSCTNQALLCLTFPYQHFHFFLASNPLPLVHPLDRAQNERFRGPPSG